MDRVTLIVRRREETLHLDTSRVITKPFFPGGEERIRNVINRVLGLTEQDTRQILDGLKRIFEDRHKDIQEVFREHFQLLHRFIPQEQALTENKRQLIGAYFTHEYSISAAAFFNPSIVPHPDQV